MKTKLEIIEDTVKYYTEDVSRRSVKQGGGCWYYLDGKMCAIGRYMKHPQIQKHECGFNFNASILSVKQDKILREEYHGHSNRFWFDLQELHDTGMYWGSKGLTEEGNKYLTHLKDKYNEAQN